MSKEGFCEFCSPQMEEITTVLPLDIKELTTLRDGVEVLGRRMMCDRDKQNCAPLKLIQHQIDRLRLGLK